MRRFFYLHAVHLPFIDYKLFDALIYIYRIFKVVSFY